MQRIEIRNHRLLGYSKCDRGVGGVTVSESTVYLADLRAVGRGWSKQEVSHLHRAANVLWQAGVSLETDAGVSDEGDPWFVFCDVESGDVLVHFARIGGEYVV